jgi:DNA-binding LacI/PurR family transcriptional regulator
VTRRPSIRDVGEAAGVSITTVSHALSGKGRLPEATRRHVRSVAEEIGYIPSRQGRGLKTGRTMLIGMQASGYQTADLVPQQAYFVDLLNAASAVAVDRGYGLVLLPPTCPNDKVASLGLDGAVIVDPVGDESLLEVLVAEEKPVVTTGRISGDSPQGTSVDNDHAAAVRLALDHLVEHGFSLPGLLTTEGGPSYVADVARGYRQWCATRGMAPRVIHVEGIPGEGNAREAMEAALNDPGFEISAIFATLDVLAIGAAKAVTGLGLSIPADLAIAALTDSPVLRAATPPITALNLHPDEIGTRAISLLLDLVDGSAEEADQTVSVTLLDRGSTAPAAPRRSSVKTAT